MILRVSARIRTTDLARHLRILNLPHMKYCPSCPNQYSDDTLKFCLQDGTPLSAAPAKQSAVDTVAFAMPVTEQHFPQTTDFRVATPEAGRTRANIVVPQPKNSSRKWLVAAAVAIPVMVICAAGGGAGYFYFSSKSVRAQIESPEGVSAPAQVETRNESKQPPAELIKASDGKEVTKTPDPEAIKAEIANLVERWKDLAEGHNADKLAQMYGEKVDYLGTPGTASAQIKSALEKTFATYNEIDIDISNLVVAVDAEGTAATALFDKEWAHEAAPKLSEGKAHFKLHLQKSGDEWKIVTEKQLKVYYIQN